jgi:hypothetical protein
LGEPGILSADTQGLAPRRVRLEDFAAFMKEQNAFWAKIIKDVGIKTQ